MPLMTLSLEAVARVWLAGLRDVGLALEEAVAELESVRRSLEAEGQHDRAGDLEALTRQMRLLALQTDGEIEAADLIVSELRELS